jgi:hypothetical protein
MSMAEGLDRRRSFRSTVLKCAQLRAGDVIFDCVILDSSDTGARIHTDIPMPFNGRMELTLEDGTVIPVRRSWVQDMEIGLEFAEDRSMSLEELLRARTAYESLCAGRPHHAVRLLRADQFYGDPELRCAAEAAEAAEVRLKNALLDRVEASAAAP